MKTAGGKPGGNPLTTFRSAATPPADAPIATTAHEASGADATGAADGFMAAARGVSERDSGCRSAWQFVGHSWTETVCGVAAPALREIK